MISVIVPTLNAEASLAQCLTALVPAVVDGLVREVIVVDGGSDDRTLDIADQAGCEIVRADVRGRGPQLIAGAKAARHPWLLFLHADTILSEGWVREAQTFIDRVDAGQRPPAAGMFRFALDDTGLRPRLLEWSVAMRCTLLRLPYGDQGLLIPRRLYEARGGYKPLKLMEDVDFTRRLARAERVMLRSDALTSAVRYKREGYARRSARNLTCLTLYMAGVPVPTIERLYRG